MPSFNPLSYINPMNYIPRLTKLTESSAKASEPFITEHSSIAEHAEDLFSSQASKKTAKQSAENAAATPTQQLPPNWAEDIQGAIHKIPKDRRETIRNVLSQIKFDANGTPYMKMTEGGRIIDSRADKKALKKLLNELGLEAYANTRGVSVIRDAANDFAQSSQKFFDKITNTISTIFHKITAPFRYIANKLRQLFGKEEASTATKTTPEAAAKATTATHTEAVA